MKTLAFLLVALLVSPAAAAPRESPTESIRNANTHLRSMLAAKAPPHRITGELRQLFDIEDLARRALVDHWAQMKPKQRKALVTTLREIVERNYVSQLRSNLKYEIEYLGEEKQDADVVVKTVIKAERGGRPVKIPVDYILHPVGDHWSAYDVITDEVSLLKNYRSQFNRIIGKEGVQGLLKRMQAKLASQEED